MILAPAPLACCAILLGPRLDPRPLATGGDATRIGGAPKLAARRRAVRGSEGIFFGIAGTGGASTALGTAGEDEESRNVLSVIDPELPLRCSPPDVDPALELPFEEVEPALRRVLLV